MVISKSTAAGLNMLAAIAEDAEVGSTLHSRGMSRVTRTSVTAKSATDVNPKEESKYRSAPKRRKRMVRGAIGRAVVDCQYRCSSTIR